MCGGEKKNKNATNLAPLYVYLYMFKNSITYIMKLGLRNEHFVILDKSQCVFWTLDGNVIL